MYEWLAQNSFCRRLLGENISICQENGNIPSIVGRSWAQLCVYSVAIFPYFRYWYLCLCKQHYGHACQRHLEDSKQNKRGFLLPYFQKPLLLLAQLCWWESLGHQPCASLAALGEFPKISPKPSLGIHRQLCKGRWKFWATLILRICFIL